MFLQNKKVLAGTLLLLLLSMGWAHGASARPGDQVAQRRTSESMNVDGKTVTGIIKSIVGEVVTLELDNGSIQNVRIPQQTQRILSLRSGMRISAALRQAEVVAEDVKVVSGEAVTERVERRTERVVTPPPERRTQERVVTPPPRRTQEQVERRTQERVVTPAPAPAPAPAPESAPAPRRPVRGLW